MNIRLSILGCLLIFWSCNNIEDASPADRTTFVRFYESTSKQEGVWAEPIDDGFIILANSTSSTDTTGLVFRTDEMGNIMWKTTIPYTFLNSIAVTTDGYFIFGDSIKVNESSEQVYDQYIYSALLHKLDLNGNIVNKIILADYDTINRTDFKSSALALNADNDLILLGTFKTATSSATERPYIISLASSNLDTLWARTYDVTSRDYVNGKSVHTTSDGYILWASAILAEQQSFTRSYLSIPYIKEESTFENNSVYGETTDQKLLAGDMQPAASPEFGYGVVGSYASTNGESSNMFFGRISKNGDFIAGSERFFDGELSKDNVAVDISTSKSEDTGDAICATNDGGFVLAGTITTTPNRGNGGTDIFLVKVDGVGNIVWNKVIGGTDNEVVSSIRQTADGGLLICGSKDDSGLPVIFIMKTNANGEVTD